ncbi:MAG TPA: DUF222 domain-containing protein, partial [Acidimicrobiia bacterium]
MESQLLATPAGAGLATLLESLEGADLGESDRVAVLQAWARLQAHVDAQVYAGMVSVAEAVTQATGSPSFDYQADEIEAALTLTRAAAADQLALAQMLVLRFPRLFETMTAGFLDDRRVRVILDGIAGLPQQTAAQIVDVLLPLAPELTTGQLRARLHQLVITADPEAAESRYRERLRERKVLAHRNPDGTAGIFGLDLPADRVTQALNHIHALARQAKTDSDLRTADQVRADVFMDLLCGQGSQTGSSGRAVVDLRIDLTTLAGL